MKNSSFDTGQWRAFSIIIKLYYYITLFQYYIFIVYIPIHDMYFTFDLMHKKYYTITYLYNMQLYFFSL